MTLPFRTHAGEINSAAPTVPSVSQTSIPYPRGRDQRARSAGRGFRGALPFRTHAGEINRRSHRGRNAEPLPFRTHAGEINVMQPFPLCFRLFFHSVPTRERSTPEARHAQRPVQLPFRTHAGEINPWPATRSAWRRPSIPYPRGRDQPSLRESLSYLL